MKYSQACLLKKQLDVAIEKLTRTGAGLGETDAVQMRLEVAHVSPKEPPTEPYAD